MSEPAKGVALNTLARLHQTTSEDLRLLVVVPDEEVPDMPNHNLDGDVGLHFQGLYQYSDALGIEVARQLHDDNGVPLSEGLRIAAYTGAVRNYFDRSLIDDHFWIAIVAARNDWGSSPRGKWPASGFGQSEFWSTMHFAGSLRQVTSDIADWIRGDETEYAASPARIFMANVSVADRRLRERAASFGIRVVGNEFA